MTTEVTALRSVETPFAVDSSGFSTSRFVRWFDEKYGCEWSGHDWVKVHLATGVKTNVVRPAVSPYRFLAKLSLTPRLGWDVGRRTAPRALGPGPGAAG